MFSQSLSFIVPTACLSHSQDPITPLLKALADWQSATQTPSDQLPTDSHLRRCDVAKTLNLRSLILRAGGHKTVQRTLNLRPPLTPREEYRRRELQYLSNELRNLCNREALPPPDVSFPSPSDIRRLAPALANRIASFPGRGGYATLAGYIGGCEVVRSAGDGKGDWRVWTGSEYILQQLEKHQHHASVLPLLTSLPKNLSAAIQRQGGGGAFARRHGMILEKEWANMRRFARLARWLSDYAGSKYSEGRYISFVKQQCESPEKFPPTAEIEGAGMIAELQRYGGRRALAMRFGFERSGGMRGLFMGEFSILFAADVLEFATEAVCVAEDGNLGMPGCAVMRQMGRTELAEVVEWFGGEEEVGRRLGLVPMKRVPEKWGGMEFLDSSEASNLLL